MRYLRALPLLAILAMLFLLAGCPANKVQPDPYIKFHESISSVSEETASFSLKTLQEERSKLIDALTDQTVAFSSILPQYPISGDPYAWSMDDEPLYIRLKRCHAGLGILNTAFLQYAAALSQMSSTSYFSTEEAKAMAEGIKKSADQALALLPVGAPQLPTTEFSLVFSEGLEAYANYKQRATLNRIVEKNQPVVQGICDHVGDYLKLLLTQVRMRTEDQAEVLKTALRNNKLDKTMSAQSVAMIEETLLAIDLIKSLDDIYRTLPRAHASLYDRGSGISLASINDMALYAIRVHALYEELNKQ